MAAADADTRPAGDRRRRSGRRARAGSRQSLRRSRPFGSVARDKCIPSRAHCQAWRQASGSGPAGDTLRVVAKREPSVVLGIEPSATPTQIKAAWRKLARQHHPDLTVDDPEASRIATRRMAAINDADAAMTKPVYAPGRGGGGAADAPVDAAPARRGGPPRPKPTRPVTGC